LQKEVGEALATLAEGVSRGTLHACAVKAMGFADSRVAILETLSS
jgi:chaperonin GroEL (HSP60 family)